MYKNKAYLIKTKTNLHAGSGDTNFGIVDNQVQRDSISNLPVVNSSSLKGAIRDHFKDFLAETNETIDNTEVKPFVFNTIFGDEYKEDTEENRKKLNEKERQKLLSKEDFKTYSKLPKQGLVKFIDAKLLFLPLRSNKKPYFYVTSIDTLKEAQSFLMSFGINLDLDTINTNGKSVVLSSEGATVEDVECQPLQADFSKIKKLFGIENLAIFNEEDFNEAVSNLPVIARNKVETNEEKGNLWYEEVLPRESILYTVFCYYNNLDDSTQDKKGKTDKKKFEMAYRLFEDKLLKDSIQIGANASIGYGITKFSKLGANNE